MKRRTRRPEKPMSGRERNLRIFMNVYLRELSGRCVKQCVVLRSVVAHLWHLFVPAAAVAAKHKRFTRVVVIALIRRDRLLGHR